jgi:hypothetical protein
LKKLCQQIWYRFYYDLIMTFNQFRYLSEDDQERILWKKGVELSRNEINGFHYILFQVDGFYMEVKYTLPLRSIIEIVCFEDVELLDPYLKKINIDFLFAA